MFDNIKYHHFFIIQERIKQRGRRKKTKAEVDTLNNFIFLPTPLTATSFLSVDAKNFSNGMTMEKIPNVMR